MTPDTLRRAWGCSQEIAERFAEPLSAACAFYGIDTPARLAAFLAQTGHESGGGKYMRELWGPTPQQLRYERDFDAPWPENAQQAKLPEFERNRLAFGLGNSEPGDGKRFMGRSGIQTTGRYNYGRVRDRLRERFPGLDVPDFVAEPQRLEEVQWACLAMCDYWDWKALNALADAGDFIAITKKINGGLNGLADRQARLKRTTAALSQAATARAPVQPIDSTLSQEATMPLPVLPLILGLANTLIGAFEPLAREKITKEMARHTDNPEVQSQIATGVIESVKVLTGKEDPVEAVIAARADPQIMAQVQSNTLADLERMAPILDKVAQWERESWAATEASRDAADKRARDNPNDQDAYLTQSIVNLQTGILVFLAVALVVAIAFERSFTEILTLFAGMVGSINKTFGTRYDNRYGSSHGSAAKDVIVGELSKRPR
jgi:putative chitinase